MAPKKKRGARAVPVRKPRTRGQGIQRRSTDEEVLESSPEPETLNEEAEKVEQTEVKSHKKFGKFRCLVTPEKVSEEAEIVDAEKVGEITENLQELIIENVDTDILVECINEEIIGDESPMEVDPEVKLLTTDSNDVEIVDIAKEAETTDETDMTENKEDETSDDKEAGNSSESSSTKKAQDKLIPSRKSTRISLKTTKLREMQSATRKPLVKTMGGKKKLKKPKQADNPVETESNDADSEESSGNKSEENDKTEDEVKPTETKGKKPALKKKLVGKPKVNVAKKMINLRMGTKTKQLIKKKKINKEPTPEKEDDENSIRRSNRIKTISNQKKTSKGKGLVKKEVKEADSDTSNSGKSDEKGSNRASPMFVAPISNTEPDLKPVKVKSRWRRSSELEMNTAQSKAGAQASEVVTTPPGTPGVEKVKVDEEVERRLKQFVHLKENQYLTERISCKEAKKMTCDCFLTDEEIKEGEYGCGEDCLNRLLMIECGNLCTVGDRCTNKKFQRGQFAPCEAFRTDKKGLGIRASANIPYGEFILEYVGEVLDPDEFEQRATEYSKDKNRHYYFMSLRADAVIDATMKGNISRFINHSCDPNAETQKWTVNGELRIGFFSKRTILAGEEITFDYQFQRYGKEAQKCYCEASTCRGWLGEEPEDGEEEEEEEEEEVEEEVAKSTVEVKEVAPAEESKIEVPAVEKVEGVVVEQPAQEKVESPKKEKVRILRPRRKTRKDLFEDLDLDDEITSLQATGLKNQAHTLKLSRLMVRAKETTQRTLLLKLLKRGELPCRRLFLDYHGLRLLHGWMTDTQHLIQTDNNKVEHLRLDILQTLAMLPIPNKTMLQDSKVLPTVEKWAISEKPAESPIDSESNSPKSEPDGVQTPVESVKAPEVKEETVEPVIEEKDEEEFQIRKSVGMEVTQKPVFRQFNLKNIAEEISSIFDDDAEMLIVMEEKEEEKPILVVKPEEKEYNVVEEILSLAGKLLDEWSTLKEVFRIPKKERIEQMKEHEREADRRYKAFNLEQENLERKRDRYRGGGNQRSRFFESNERTRRCMKNEDRGYMHLQISKHERRKMFAMQVEQIELERRRNQQEFWQQHVKNCMMMGTDPMFTAPYDPNRGYQCIWNPQIGQWQNYQMQMDQTIMFNHNVPMPHMPNANYPYIPPAALPPQPMQPNPGMHGMHSMPPQNPHPQPVMESNMAQHMHTRVPPPTNNIPVPSNISQVMMPPVTMGNMASVGMVTMPPVNMGAMPPNMVQPNMPAVSMGSMPPNMAQSNMTPVSMGTMPPNMGQPNMPPVSMGTLPPNMAPPNRTQPNMAQPNMPPVNISNLPPNMAPHNMPLNRTQPNISPNMTQSNMPAVNISTPNMAPPNMPPVSMGTMPPNMAQANRTQPNMPPVNVGTLPPNMALPNMPPNRTQQNLSPSNMPSVNIGTLPPNRTQPNILPPVSMGTMPPNIVQPNMPPASMGTMPPMPNIPPMPTQPYKEEEEPLRVKFMGPIPPPAKLPPKWKCAKDKYGRPYYYHIKIRKSQWEPPEFPPEEEYASDSTSSSDTSSISSDSSSDDSDSDEIDDSALMLEIRNKFKNMENQKKLETTKKEEFSDLTPITIKTEMDEPETSIEGANVEYKSLEEILAEDNIEREMTAEDSKEETISSLDKRLIEELGLLKSSEPPQKKRRLGLVQEILISPRTEEDRLQFREDIKKYKQNKEKLKKQKEIIMLQTKKHAKSPGNGNEASTSSTSTSSTGGTTVKVKKKITVKTKLKELEGSTLELTKKIKESFRSSMASVMVGILNAYRKPDCKQGRINNTEDFKHLARKLTHFVMLKELKHCQKIEDLTCTDSVKQKAKEFVRKYMSKFGEAYLRPTDDLDNY